MSDESTCELNVDADDSRNIEITIKEYKPPRPRICQTWDRCKHRRSDSDNEEFLRLHPECE